MPLITSHVKVLQTIKAHTSDINCIEFWGNHLLFTGSSDKTVRVWRWNVGKGFVEEVFSPLLGHKYGVTCVRVSPQRSTCCQQKKRKECRFTHKRVELKKRKGKRYFYVVEHAWNK